MKRSTALMTVLAIMIACVGGIGIELAAYTLFGPGEYAGVWSLEDVRANTELHMSDSASVNGTVSLTDENVGTATADAATESAMTAPTESLVMEQVAVPTNYYEDAPELPLPQYVMDKLYSPFYVLDVEFGSKYAVKSEPDGNDSSGDVYGQQVGVNVLDISDGWAHITANRYPGGRPIEGYVPEELLKEIVPDERYSIVIDKLEQRLYLFEYGELVDEMLCSTGKTTSETPAGEFVKMGTKSTIISDSDPDVAYDGIRINGRVYIHSVSEIDGDYSASIDMLGRKASHGCIRVPLEKAEWFYNEISDNTKVMVIEYRGDTPELGTGGRGEPAEQYLYPEAE